MKTNSQKAIPDSQDIHIGGRKSVCPKHILMLEADINYTTIHLFNGEQFIIATTIKKVQKSLDSHGKFVRASKKFVVNFDYVSSHCAKQLTLKNNQIIPFSRRKGKLFMEKMAK